MKQAALSNSHTLEIEPRRPHYDAMRAAAAQGLLTSALIVVAFALHALVYDLLADPLLFDRDRYYDGGGDDDDAAPTLSVSDGSGAAIDHRQLPDYEAPRAEFDPWRLLPYQSSDADDGGGGGSDYGYAVLLISYHKTGHDLGMDLLDFVKYEFPSEGPSLTEHGNHSPLKHRRHPPTTPCSRIHLQSGAISIQHAPDLFCTPEELAQILLLGGPGHLRTEEGDRGVKVVHLVRDPFEMAVSNYHYHAQVPTPEPWVNRQNPCDIEYKEEGINENFAHMVLPTLSQAKYSYLDLQFEGALLSKEEFDAVTHDCLSLYRTKEGLEEASFLDHLMNYDAPEGLRLATAEMMVQGFHNGGDVLRMATHILKLKQAQVKVQTDPLRFQNKELQVYTVSLDDFIERPEDMAYRFFDYVLEGTVSREEKEEAATRYGEYFEGKLANSRHVTHGKRQNSAELQEYLQNDPVFGPPLRKVERLVETGVEEGRAGIYNQVTLSSRQQRKKRLREEKARRERVRMFAE